MLYYIKTEKEEERDLLPSNWTWTSFQYRPIHHPPIADWDITSTPQQNTVPLFYFDRFIRGILSTLTGGRLGRDGGGGGGADGTFVQTSFRSCFLRTSLRHDVELQEDDDDDGDEVINMDSSKFDDDIDHQPSDGLDGSNNNNEALKRKIVSISDELMSDFSQLILWLESKQDEILLDTNMKMPILEFGAGMIFFFSLFYWGYRNTNL